MSKTYYCTKCSQRHIKTGDIGKKHGEFGGEAPVKPPAPTETPTPDVVEAPPTPRQGCAMCNDTGVVLVGSHPVADGTERQYRTYCKCGQETYDERIGLTPRRPGLRPAGPISDEDRAEADYRRSYGLTHDEYLTVAGAGEPD